MNNFRTTLLTFFWSIPFAFILGRLSLFYNDEFLGEWIRSPLDYPLSYSIFLGVVFSCGAILNWMLGNIKSYSKLIYILSGIFLGSIINLFLFIFGFIKIVSYFYLIVCLFFVNFLPSEWAENTLIIFWSIGFIFLLIFLSKKLDNNKEKLFWAILIITVPFLPIIVPPLVGCYFGDRLSSVDRIKLSLPKRFLLGNFQIALIILCLILVMKSYHLPGLIVSPNLRNIWGSNFDYSFNTDRNYKAATKKISNCQSIKNEIGEIKSIALFEGNNYTLWDIAGSTEGDYLHIQIIGENKQAFVKGCFVRSDLGTCLFAHHGVKKENQNKAKIISETGVKTIEVLECL